MFWLGLGIGTFIVAPFLVFTLAVLMVDNRGRDDDD